MIQLLFKNHPIVHAIQNKAGIVANLTNHEEALLLHAVIDNETRIIVKPNLYQAQQLYNQMYILMKEDVILFQADESLRFESIASSPETSASIIENLYELQNRKVRYIITHIHAFLRFLPNPTVFNQHCITLRVDAEMQKSVLEKKLVALGYVKVAQVDRPMTFASRGGIVDVFSINQNFPTRIEFFDTEIESIRYFDIETQKTIQRISETVIIPATTLLLDHNEYAIIEQKITQFDDKLRSFLTFELDCLKNHYTDMRLYRLLSLLDTHYHLTDYVKATIIYDTIETLTFAHQQFEMDTALFQQELLEIQQGIPHAQYYFELLKPDFCFHQFSLGAIPVDIQSIEKLRLDKDATLLEMLQLSLNQNIVAALSEHQIEIIQNRIKNDHLMSNVTFIKLPLTKGFIYQDTTVYSASELFNEIVTVKRKNNKFKNGKILNNYMELSINDYVVHEKYGIGKYLGIVTKFVNSVHKDFLSVEYANQTKLFIPVEQFQLVRKYLSKDALSVKLSAIGTSKWSKEKEKIQKGVSELAEQLLQLYTERNQQNGFVYAKDDELQRLFEQDFAYELTKDQKTSVTEIKQEMESSKIMDRLLCGDVGFGKTEVAAISAFKAVNNGKQVAYLCPTTILSNQHYKTFKKRFMNFPVRIELLNRFVSTKQAKEIIEDTKNGLVDILIGTHRILSNDVEFSQLGFLIIDEEQRFGVSQKEKIKQLKQNVDVLSLSATPIPRTLQMSLVGIRSLSQLDTPPKNRYSVQTYILESNEKTIQSIIEREIARDGQVFYLFNDTVEIYAVANHLQNTIPGIKVGVGHGKMTKNELEDVMMKFINNEFHVLVCTTIIETGIDIPNANTIIVHDADKFGLAQLYQIKGRVGRGDKIAYAYLMYAQNKVLTQEADARLKAIKEFTQLGSGYKIAMKDLSIRGAGNMLGDKQAGFIDTVGMDMYIDMLSKAVHEKQGILQQQENIESTNIQVDGYIPENFTDYDSEKLQLYQNIASINNLSEFYELYQKIVDIFGVLPKSVESLFIKRKLDILLNHEFIASYQDTSNLFHFTFSKEYSQQVNGEQLFKLTLIHDKDISILYRNKQLDVTFRKFNDYLPILATFIEEAIHLVLND